MHSPGRLPCTTSTRPTSTVVAPQFSPTAVQAWRSAHARGTRQAQKRALAATRLRRDGAAHNSCWEIELLLAAAGAQCHSMASACHMATNRAMCLRLCCLWTGRRHSGGEAKRPCLRLCEPQAWLPRPGSWIALVLAASCAFHWPRTNHAGLPGCHNRFLPVSSGVLQPITSILTWNGVSRAQGGPVGLAWAWLDE